METKKIGLNKQEKFVLFNQLLDIRKALSDIKPLCLPMRFGGEKELTDVIKKLK